MLYGPNPELRVGLLPRKAFDPSDIRCGAEASEDPAGCVKL